MSKFEGCGLRNREHQSSWTGEALGKCSLRLSVWASLSGASRTEVSGTVSYPLWDLFLTMLELFVWIVLIVLVVWTILNILRSHRLSAWAKVGWLVLVIVVPFIGVFAYLIVRGAQLADEQVSTANAPQDEAARRYQRFEAHGSPD